MYGRAGRSGELNRPHNGSDSFMEQMAVDDEAAHASLGAQIESLSGVFSAPWIESRDHLVSNDQGMEQVLPQIRERLQLQPGGLAIFIGAGAIASLAPDLRNITAVSIDVNDKVLEFNSLLNQAIVSESLELSELGDQAAICRHVARILSLGGGMDYTGSYIEDEILSEASRFGVEHWSSPARIASVADALRVNEPTYVAADISDSRFITALAAICRGHRQSITFANLTNVHEYVDGSDMSFLRKLPFDPYASILYSIDNSLPLQSGLASSLGAYLQSIEASWEPSRHALATQ